MWGTVEALPAREIVALPPATLAALAAREAIAELGRFAIMRVGPYVTKPDSCAASFVAESRVDP